MKRLSASGMFVAWYMPVTFVRNRWFLDYGRVLFVFALLLGALPGLARCQDPWIGLVYSSQAVTVSTQIAADVMRVYVNLGDRVEAGDVIVRLNLPGLVEEQARADAQIAIAAAKIDETESRMRLKEREYVRRKAAAGSISVEELNRAENEYEAARAQLLSARAQHNAALAERALLDIKQQHTVITAPISGVVSARIVQAGNAVTSGDPVAEIINPNDLLVRFVIPEYPTVSVAPGHRVDLRVNKSRVASAEITAIAPSIDPVTRLRIAEARLVEPQPGLVGQGVEVVAQETVVQAAGTEPSRP